MPYAEWWKQKFLTGIIIGLTMSMTAGYLYFKYEDLLVSVVYDGGKAVYNGLFAERQPKGVSQGDWYFGCRKSTACPSTR